MSLIWTESFAGFEKWEDDPVPPTEAYFDRTIDALSAAGWVVRMLPAGTNSSLSKPKFGISSADNRATSLVVPRHTLGSQTVASLLTLLRTIPPSGKPVICGFSVYVPESYTPFESSWWCIKAGIIASNYNIPINGPAASIKNTVTAFTVQSDLSVTQDDDHAISSKRLIPGETSYFEFYMDGRQTLAWLNDDLVVQTSPPDEVIGNQVFLGLRRMTNVPTGPDIGGWEIGDFYLLQADDVSPNTRLGSKTRVFAARPDGDFQTDFSRPAGFTSNSQVASEDLQSITDNYLTADFAGDTDIYTTPYDPTISDDSTVLGVVVKSAFANAGESDVTMKPIIRSGVADNSENTSAPEKAYLHPFFVYPRIPYCVTVHPVKGIFVGGLLMSSTTIGVPAIWFSDDGGESWGVRTGFPNAQNQNPIAYIHCMENGNIVAGQNRLTQQARYYYNRNSEPPNTWTHVAMNSSRSLTPLVNSSGTGLVFANRASAVGLPRDIHLINFPSQPPNAAPSSAAYSAPHPNAGYSDLFNSNGRLLLVRRYTPFNMYYSDDSGATWIEANRDFSYLSTAPARHLVINKTSTGTLVVLESLADRLWLSYDNGENWTLGPSVISRYNNETTYEHCAIIGSEEASFITRSIVLGIAAWMKITYSDADGVFTQKIDPVESGAVQELSNRFNNALTLGDGTIIAALKMANNLSGGALFVVPSQAEPLDKTIPAGQTSFTQRANFSTIDPATGLPWEAQDAALVKLGVQLTS